MRTGEGEQEGERKGKKVKELGQEKSSLLGSAGMD